MLTLLSIWLIVMISMMLMSGRSSAGLPLAYVTGLSMIHVPGAALQYWHDDALAWTRTGFEQTIIGMVCFLVGVMSARYVAFIRHPHPDSNNFWQSQPLAQESSEALNRLATRYILAGGGIYFFVMPFASVIPSATALVSAVASLVMVGFCLRLWVARESENWPRFWSTVALMPLLPLTTVVQGGFLGFGTYWVVAIACFLFAQSKQRIGYFVLTPAVVYVGLTIFVNYMGARDDIRETVWNVESSVGDRLERVEAVFRNFEWFDPSISDHRRAIQLRLNESWLVGAAVENLEDGEVEYASGATIGRMIVSLIPRALWPDKPDVGGGGTVVSEFTGIEFDQSTSIGAGQVFEFYINFGVIGVICGFLLYGWMFAWLDIRIIEYLHRGDQKGFLFCFLISLAMLQPGGNLVEITVSAAASAATAYGLGRFFHLDAAFSRRMVAEEEQSRLGLTGPH